MPGIRWELLREGEEDYEYLRLAANGSIPATPDVAAGCDATAKSAAASTTSFTRDSAALQHLRDELGYYLEGKRDGGPLLDSKPAGAHPGAGYFLNFQDPAGGRGGGGGEVGGGGGGERGGGGGEEEEG